VTPGDVALDFVEANENRMIGADIYANGQVDIANSSFDNNTGTTLDASNAEVYWGCGLQVTGMPAGGVTVGVIQNCDPQNLSASSINLDTVTANGNFLFGADLYASGAVNVSGSFFSNNATPADQANAQGGLMIDSGGSVALSNVTASDNGMFGADIVAVDFITVQNSVFGQNLNGFGLSAVVTSSTGFITLNNVSGLGNAGDGAYADAICVFLNGGAYTGNSGYGLNAPQGFVDVTALPTYASNTLGDTNPNPFNPCEDGSDVIINPTSPLPYTPLTQSQLPAPLGQGNTFASAFQVNGSASSFELSFPIPAGMESMDLVVMFWNGSGWVEVPGGSVVGSEFVITVTQPGIYVLVAQST
jgi:hypothetical protein